MNVNEMKNEDMDYKVLIDMIHESEDQLKLLEDFANNRMKTHFHMNPSILDNILTLTEEAIHEISLEDGKAFLIRHYNETDEEKELTKLIEDYQFPDDPSEENISQKEAIRQILLDIKEDSMSIYQVREQLKSLISESNDILKEYNEYLGSSEVRTKRLERLERMRAMADKEEDESKKKEILKKIKIMEDSYSLDFVFERFNTYKEKEVQSIVESFFDKKKSSYITNRYRDKLKAFGFNPKVYKYFLDLEDNFLPEEYKCFNNLFLFIYMRMIAYFDPNNKTDKLYAQSITSSMANLIYHKFEKREQEEKFIEIIQTTLDHFMDYKDYFTKNNITSPLHPVRIENMKKHEEIRKKVLIEKMDQMGISGYPSEGTADELQEFFNDAVEELVKKQEKEENNEEDDKNVVDENITDEDDRNITEEKNDEENVIVTEDEKTGEVSVVPTMKKTEDVSDKVSEVVQNVSGVRVRCVTAEEEFEKFKSGEGYHVGDIVVVYPNTKKDDDNGGKDESESDRILYCFDGENWNKIDTVESEIDTDGNLTVKVKSDDSMVVDIKRRC